MHPKMSKLMKQAEEQIGSPFPQKLAKMLTEHGLTETAQILNVSKATLKYWIVCFEITWYNIVASPGDVIHVIRADGSSIDIAHPPAPLQVQDNFPQNNVDKSAQNVDKSPQNVDNSPPNVDK